MRRKLRALADAAALALLVALDARDVWFKLRWLGPDARAAFPSTLRAVLAVADADAPLTARAAANATGWSSFLDTCATLAPFRGGHFQHALGSRCRVFGDRSDDDDSVLVDSLVLTSDVRVDAMAWAACRLLHAHQRPPVCHEGLVTDFLRRYQLAAPLVGPEMMATPASHAEGELLALLDVVSKSSPLSAVVCVSGFELDRDRASASAVDSPRVFGCGSPNRGTSAFVGTFATAFAALQADKAWLALDNVSVLDMRFRVRQSALASYAVATTRGAAGRESLVLETRAAVSLRCSGALFTLMVVADVALLAVHAWSALELARVFRRLQSEPETAAAQLDRLCFFSSSLARSAPVAALTLAAAGLSWLLVLPTAAVLQLSRSKAASAHAYLTALRLWSLLLLALNAAWDVAVRVGEKRAYAVASRTFVATWELAAVVLCAFHLLRERLASLQAARLELERQRLVDASTFPGVLALSNTFGDGDWAEPDAAPSALWTIYSRLAQLLLLSLVAVAVVLTMRYCLAKHSAAAATAGYMRLPLEELLDAPIRARSLVRFGGALERCVGGERFLWPAQHLAHGVLVESKHFLGVRRGFLHPLPAHLPADGRGVAPAHDTVDEEPAGSPKRRRYVSPLRQ